MRIQHNSKTNMYSPWVVFSRKIEVLFENDPEVDVRFNEDSYTITLLVDNENKAFALSKIMPESKTFGNVEVKINIIPPDGDDWGAKYFEAAFTGNGAFSHMTVVKDLPGAVISNPIAYCVFKKEVVQYSADDLSSESGLTSTLYQDIARDIFGDTEGVFFCTDIT